MFCFKKSKKMLGTWMVQKMEIPSVHKIAKIFGKNEFESLVFKNFFFHRECSYSNIGYPIHHCILEYCNNLLL